MGTRREPKVVSALLRVENPTGVRPARWEKPSKTHTFWVLELPTTPTETVAEWTALVLPVLHGQTARLRRFRQAGSPATLHVVTTRTLLPVVFEPTLLECLGGVGVRLEHIVE